MNSYPASWDDIPFAEDFEIRKEHATVRLRKREDVWPVTFALRNLRIPSNVGFTVEHDPTIIPDWELDGPDSIAVQFTSVLDVKVATGMIALTVDAWGRVADALSEPHAYSTGRQIRGVPVIVETIADNTWGQGPDDVVGIDFERWTGLDEWDVTLTIAQAAGIVVEPS